jgi:peptidoglycan/LPS O-acetylase OafA/YrhL
MSRVKSWRRCVGYGFTSLTILTVLLFAFGHANNDPTGTFGSVRMLFCFISGIALYRCYQLLPNLNGATASWITVLALIFIGITLFFPGAPVLDSFAFAALIFGLAYRSGPVNAALESRFAVFLGKISFSFYISHYLIIGITTWAIGHWLVEQDLGVRISSLLVLTAVCLGVAVLLYHGVERPSQRLGRYYVARNQIR